RTAIHPAVRLVPVAEDAAAAVRACRRELLDRALEAVERMRLAAGDADRESLVVAVAAHFAGAHVDLLGRASLARRALVLLGCLLFLLVVVRRCLVLGALAAAAFDALPEERHQVHDLGALRRALFLLGLGDLLGLAGLDLLLDALHQVFVVG